MRRGLGDAAADSANYLKMAASVNPGSALYNAIMGCAQNPTPTCATASASWFNAGYYTPAQQTLLNQAAASGNAIPVMQPNIGPPPGTYLPTPQPTPVATPSAPVQTQPVRNVIDIITRRPAFSVASGAPIAASQPVQMAQPAGAQQPTDTTSSGTDFFSQTLFGIPVWLLGAAAIGGVLLLGGSHGR